MPPCSSSTPSTPGVGKSIETYAKAHGVDVIDYDRLTLGGSAEYYVSFNNVQVGKLIGQGLVSCVAAWKVAKPQVVVMHGAATDNNATQFAQGYDAVLKPYFKSGKWVDVTNTADTWDPPTAETEFQEAYTAHPNINAALIPNDETGSPIISYLQSQHVAPKTFPTTGQDATATGLDNILSGYQCGTVYKPIFIEASAASAIAIYLRAGKKPPTGLDNGTTVDPTSHRKVTVVAPHPGVGDHREHELDGDRGQLRACIAALHRFVRRRLHRSGYNSISSSVRASGGPGVTTSSHPPPAPAGGGCCGPEDEEEGRNEHRGF